MAIPINRKSRGVKIDNSIYDNKCKLDGCNVRREQEYRVDYRTELQGSLLVMLVLKDTIMLNKIMLKQAREGFKRNIAVNRSRITLTRQPTTTDPITGEQVADPTGTATTHTIYCRITHERSQVPENEANPAGLSTNLQRMIMTDWENIPQENDTFTWNEIGWEVGPVDPVIQFGGIIGYQAPLQEAT